MDYSVEEWKPVFGYESWYEVSSHGRVRRTAPGKNTYPGKIIDGHVMNVGYRCVGISRPGVKGKQLYVHQLVAIAFLGERPVGHEVNHIDGNQINNRASNLEWVTKAEQARHACRIGLSPVGEQRHNAKLTYEDIRAIRASDKSDAALAKKFNIGRAYIWMIKNHRVWNHPPAA